IVRPFETLLRISPPMCVSCTSRTYLRYSDDCVWGDWPWKAMKINCATSSRAVMVRIQRRTVADALGRGADLGGAGFRTAGTTAQQPSSNAITARKNGDTTTPVCQI